MEKENYSKGDIVMMVLFALPLVIVAILQCLGEKIERVGTSGEEKIFKLAIKINNLRDNQQLKEK